VQEVVQASMLSALLRILCPRNLGEVPFPTKYPTVEGEPAHPALVRAHSARTSAELGVATLLAVTCKVS